MNDGGSGCLFLGIGWFIFCGIWMMIDDALRERDLKRKKPLWQIRGEVNKRLIDAETEVRKLRERLEEIDSAVVPSDAPAGKEVTPCQRGR